MCVKHNLELLKNFFKTIINRRKIIVPEEGDSLLNKNGEKLEKCLSLFDLIMLGSGSCLGSGMYIVVGFVAKDIAGPAVMLSFLIGGFASLLSGICYAEFACRVPKTTGGAYVYSYITVGELIAFITGWNLILEYMIGTASGAIGISSLINTLSNGEIADYMTNHTFPVIGRSYPDFISFGIGLGMTAILAAGVKSSIAFNNALNVINIIVWIFTIVAGAFYASPRIWRDYGFMPYGMSGVFSGAATCFYAFIGFDLLATTGEETPNAGRLIPIAVIITLVICLTVYVTVSVIVTLMVPYSSIASNSALVSVFKQRNVPGAEYVITVGALAGLTVSLLGSAFPMPRIIYAMGSDGLLFAFLAKITPQTKTPLVATVISGTMAALLSLTIGLKQLIEMMSIGTLLAYSMVSLSILLLRYRPDPDCDVIENVADKAHVSPIKETNDEEDLAESSDVVSHSTYFNDKNTSPKINAAASNGIDTNGSYNGGSYEYERFDDEASLVDDEGGNASSNWSNWFERLKPYFDNKNAVVSDVSSARVSGIMWWYFYDVFILCLTLVLGESAIRDGKLWIYIIIIITLMLGGFIMLSLWCQPMSRRKCSFMAPCLPFLPCAALFINCYLMMKLSPFTWIRFAVWMVIGMSIYFTYGVKTAERIYKERMEIMDLLRKKTADTVSQTPLQHAQPGLNSSDSNPEP